MNPGEFLQERWIYRPPAGGYYYFRCPCGVDNDVYHETDELPFVCKTCGAALDVPKGPDNGFFYRKREKALGLLGKDLEQIAINGDKTFILFAFKDGTGMIYSAEGDCCSQSWFEHISGVEALQGKITGVEEIAGASWTMQQPPERWIKDDHIEVYFIKITTDRGRATIELRNASNGFYGGTFESITPSDWAQTWIEKEQRDFKQVKDDF